MIVDNINRKWLVPTARNFTATQPFGASTNVGSLYYLMSMSQLKTGGIYIVMFLITRWSKTWVINVRREDLMKKEANYLNIKCWNVVSILMLQSTQFMNPAKSKKHLDLYGMLSQLVFLFTTHLIRWYQIGRHQHTGPHRHKSQGHLWW